MRSLPKLLVLISSIFLLHSLSGASAIVRDGEARAVIITADEPVPAVALAAREFRDTIAKISGAVLPIHTESEAQGSNFGADVFRVYIGSGRRTAELGIRADGLEWGGYRQVSRDNWLVLLGDDTRFEPRGIYALSRNQWENEAEAEWLKVAGYDMANPFGKLWMHYNRELDLWRFDTTGSLDAVYGFLRDLGVRWYNQGEIGEIIPELATITVEPADATVKPDFTKRIVAFARYGLSPVEEILWTLRLGSNYPYGYTDYHGMAHVTRSQYIKDNHPEYLALYNGERSVNQRRPKPCLSNQGLFDEMVRYARLMFDVYDVPVVSVWPEDGFTAICQCPDCAGKDTPERGLQGLFSDYVWDFINRIAIEIEKSHPGKYISGGAYSTYMLPPENIDKLNDNVLVYVVNGRRRYIRSEEQRVERLDLLRQWKEKTGNKVIVFMNFGGAANTPNIIAEDITNSHPYSMGDDLWVQFHRGSLANPGYNHLNYYIALRWLWDSSQDIDAVLDEYYADYYGPAAKEMEAFVNYFEREQVNMRTINSAPLMGKALELFDAAQAKVDPESIYGQRTEAFAIGLKGLRARYAEMKAGRVGVPTYELSRDSEAMANIKIDGILDESFWDEMPGELREIVSGDEPQYKTRFKMGLDDHAFYVGIICYDVPGQPFNAELLEKQTSAIWLADVVEIMLETPTNSYYQLGVNPRGSRVDLDRGTGVLRTAFNWDSQADFAVFTNEEEGFWTIEARIPFTDSTQDPLHQIIGTPPSAENPWHFNIARQRARNQREVLEMSAFSPTGVMQFHQILKFGKLE